MYWNPLQNIFEYSNAVQGFTTTKKRDKAIMNKITLNKGYDVIRSTGGSSAEMITYSFPTTNGQVGSIRYILSELTLNPMDYYVPNVSEKSVY